MTSGKNAVETRVESLSIETWHQLGIEGNMLPVTIYIDGDSMRPLIRRGRDKVTIIPISREPMIGDVVLFKGGNKRYVVHRLYKKNGDCMQTLGDNCYYPDPWMPKENIWGIVVKMERNGRIIRLDSRGSRIFGRFWMFIYPVRIFYWNCRRLAAKLYRRIFHKKAGGGNY